MEPMNHDGLVLAYLMEIYKQGLPEDNSRFMDRLERAKLCVERDLLKAENRRLKGEKPLEVIQNES